MALASQTSRPQFPTGGLPADLPTERVNPFVSEWNEVLKDPDLKDASATTMILLQEKYIDFRRSRWDFDKFGEAGFKQAVEQPVRATTDSDPRYAYDPFDSFGGTEKALLHAESALSTGLFGLGKLARDTLLDTENVPETGMGLAEAQDIVDFYSAQRAQEIPTFGKEYMLGKMLPETAKIVAEYWTLGKAGLPVGTKELTKAHPIAGKMISVSQMMAAHEVGTVQGWSDPGKKATDIVKSAGLGLGVGALGAYVPNRMTRMGTITAVFGAKTYLSSVASGADWQQSAKESLRSMQNIIAIEIVGGAQNWSKARKFTRATIDKGAARIRKANPGMSNNMARALSSSEFHADKAHSLEIRDIEFRDRLKRVQKSYRKKGEELPQVYRDEIKKSARNILSLKTKRG